MGARRQGRDPSAVTETPDLPDVDEEPEVSDEEITVPGPNPYTADTEPERDR